MSDMKCPFCNKPLQPTLRQSDEYWCENYDCPRTNIEWVGSQKLWQELIRTSKALDAALDGLTVIGGYLDYNDCVGIALDTKDEIYKILEQKD
jgi:hypothetical protein